MKNAPNNNAQKNAKSAQAAKNYTRSVSLMTKLIIFILSLATIIVSTYAFIFFIFGMLPTIVAILTDKRFTKAASSTVGAFNLIGVLPYIIEFWRNPSDAIVTAQIYMSNVNVWFRIYSLCAIGWVLIWAIPTISGHIFVARIDSKAKRLKKQQDELTEEWGSIIRRQ